MRRTEFEELSPSPAGELVGASEQLARALATAQERAWITEEEARTMFLQVLGREVPKHGEVA